MAGVSEESIQVWNVTEPYISLSCELGEGPHFEESTRTLRFVDILGKKLHRFHVDQGESSLETYDTEDGIGVTVDIDGDESQLIVAAKSGFAFMGRNGGKLKYIAAPYSGEKAERMRFNDGAVDPAGRFLAGTMTDPALHNEILKEGALFRLDSPASPSNAYTTTLLLEPISIPNGLGWSLDGRTMYHTDSLSWTIWAYDYDVDSGKASNRRAWYEMTRASDNEVPHFKSPKAGDKVIAPHATPPNSAPDGWAFDAIGDIWTAVYGAGKVLRVRDVNGRGVVVGCVQLPVSNVTCPRFVDEDLVITTAKGGDSNFGGCTFRVHVGVRGRPVRSWKQ